MSAIIWAFAYMPYAEKEAHLSQSLDISHAFKLEESCGMNPQYFASKLKSPCLCKYQAKDFKKPSKETLSTVQFFTELFIESLPKLILMMLIMI